MSLAVFPVSRHLWNQAMRQVTSLHLLIIVSSLRVHRVRLLLTCPRWHQVQYLLQFHLNPRTVTNLRRVHQLALPLPNVLKLNHPPMIQQWPLKSRHHLPQHQAYQPTTTSHHPVHRSVHPQLLFPHLTQLRNPPEKVRHFNQLERLQQTLRLHQSLQHRSLPNLPSWKLSNPLDLMKSEQTKIDCA